MSATESESTQSSNTPDPTEGSVTGDVAGHTAPTASAEVDDRHEHTDKDVMHFDGVLELPRDGDGKQQLSGQVYIEKPARSSAAKRQKRSRKKKQDKGMERKEFWIYPELTEQAKAHIENLNQEYEAGLPPGS